MPGRPKGSKNKTTATETVGNTTFAAKQLPLVIQKIEVQRSPLHVSASVGVCFKTGRVGITSLSIQCEYEGDVTSGVDNIANLCLKEWDRLAKEGITRNVPDTYYGDLQKKAEEAHSNDKPKPPISSKDTEKETELDFDIGNFDENQFETVDNTLQNVSTVADGEAALKEIEETAEINEAKQFKADEPVDIPNLDDFDVLAMEFEDDKQLTVKAKEVAETLNITEEVVEPEVNADGDLKFKDRNVDAAETLGFDNDDFDGFDVAANEVSAETEEKLEKNEPSMLCVFDLSTEQQRAELIKRGITEINGVPVAEAPEPEIIVVLDEALAKEQE